MFPRVNVTGNVARHLQQGFQQGHPITLVLLLQEYYVDSRTGHGRNVTEQYLVKLWPQTEVLYNQLVNRFHVGALIEVSGTMRTGVYQNAQGTWMYNPTIDIAQGKISVLRKSAAVKEAELEAGVHIPYNMDVDYGLPTAEDYVYEKPQPGPVVRRPSTTKKTTGTRKPAEPQVDSDLDTDLPF